MIEKREEVREEKQVVNLQPASTKKIEKLRESGLRDRLKKFLQLTGSCIINLTLIREQK